MGQEFKDLSEDASPGRRRKPFIYVRILKMENCKFAGA